jgi:hypothetical protein
VGGDFIEDDVDGRIRIGGDEVLHGVEEFNAPPAFLVSRPHLCRATSKAANRVEVPLGL